MHEYAVIVIAVVCVAADVPRLVAARAVQLKALRHISAWRCNLAELLTRTARQAALSAGEIALSFDYCRTHVMVQGVTVVQTANDGIDAINRCRQMMPRAVLANLNMPRCSTDWARRCACANCNVLRPSR